MKSYVLYSKEAGSTVLVSVSEYDVWVRGVDCAPPASVLVWLVDEFDSVRQVIVRHLVDSSPAYKYAVKAYRRSSGAVDLVVYHLIDEPAVVPYAKVHISMYRRLNQCVYVPGNVLPLIAERVREIDPRTYEWKVCPPYAGIDPQEFRSSLEILQLIPDYEEVLNDENDYTDCSSDSSTVSSRTWSN